jgi:hypothetical protein
MRRIRDELVVVVVVVLGLLTDLLHGKDRA